MKAAAINVFEALKPYGGLPILFVHDELVCQVPAGTEQELMPVVVDAMREAASAVDPPISVEATTTRKSYAHKIVLTESGNMKLSATCGAHR
jgi:DNA polymerase I-like protein with 3'-5' exonuclease and polymerase domains